MSAQNPTIEIKVLGLVPMRLDPMDVERLREQSLQRMIFRVLAGNEERVHVELDDAMRHHMVHHFMRHLSRDDMLLVIQGVERHLVTAQETLGHALGLVDPRSSLPIEIHLAVPHLRRLQSATTQSARQQRWEVSELPREDWSRRLLRATGLESLIPVLHRGRGRPVVTLADRPYDAMRDNFRGVVRDAVSGASTCTRSYSLETFGKLVRDHLLKTSLCLSKQGTTGSDESLSGLRLSRHLHDVITGTVDGTGAKPPSSEAARRRIELWRRAVREVPVPALPPELLTALNTINPRDALLWTSAVYRQEDTQGEPLTPFSRPPDLEIAFVHWLRHELLEPSFAPLQDLLRCNPALDADHETLDQSIDKDFLEKLDAAGGRIVATTAAHRGIEIHRAGPTLLRLNVVIPEHVAGTDIIVDRASRFIHWPAAIVGIQVSFDQRLPRTGILPNEYRIWNGTSLEWHPIINLRGELPRTGEGSVCVDNSAQHAAQKAIAAALSPGLVVAAQLLEVRHTFLYGINSTNSNRLFHKYSKVHLDRTSKNEPLPYQLLDEAEAHRLSKDREIPLIPYWR